ncbi:MAG: hypothetical protein Q8M74_00440 [Chloroflexota bacterium]|nr:hypothetical protein [Chloroflexota bacterium]
MTDAPDLAAVEARLAAILAPYRDRLELATIYNIPTLRRPGSKAHAYFAGMSVAEKHVSLHLMPIYHDPSLLDGISPALRKRVSGKATLKFVAVDEPVFADLETLVARSFEAYIAAEQGRTVGG